MIARDYIADKIKADNSAFIVDRYPREYPDNLSAGKTYVQVFREGVSRANDGLKHSLKVGVFVAKQEGNQAENDLEGALDQILLSLESLDGVSWEEAARVVYGGKWNAYEVSVALNTNNAYRTANFS